MKVLDQMLTELLSRKHKILIFSQMTKMLDIIGDYLNYKVILQKKLYENNRFDGIFSLFLQKLTFSRLDGSMGFEDRQENIDAFNDDPTVNVFLLSTRAGGLGINLTSADTCM